jgi:O-antigen biosynthesis protein
VLTKQKRIYDPQGIHASDERSHALVAASAGRRGNLYHGADAVDPPLPFRDQLDRERSLMSIRRPAGSPRLIDWPGEPSVPGAPDVQVVHEHLHRYLWAAHLVGSRRVLDLGSGEGFGATILAETAEYVLGVDIDGVSVEHSRLNYAAKNLEFAVGTALDLSAYADESFEAVVALEVIEHVPEQDRVLAEIARVLTNDGILVMSTPERRSHRKSGLEANSVHRPALPLNRLLELVGRQFRHVACWGQCAITGSYLNLYGDPVNDGEPTSSDFFIERAHEEWRLADASAAPYCIALASNAPLPALARSSTLADPGLELEREDELQKSLERERAEHVRVLRERDVRARRSYEQREQDVLGAEERRSQLTLASSDQTIIQLRAQLASTVQAARRTEESVTWQAFQRGRSRLYGALGGEQSLRARALRATLLFAGRRVTRRPRTLGLTSQVSIASDTPEVIQMPEYEEPRASLIIPVHAHAPLTRACLCSIRDCTANVAYEVILVDDTADAETRRLLADVRGAKILRNDENLGFLRSMNRGASVARGEWLVLFNNDTEVTRGWLSALLECANSAPDVGVVAPKFVYPDGSLNEAGGIVWRNGTAMNYGRGDEPNRFQYQFRRETDYGSAAALMVSAELWKEVGGFDERYRPIYYEDTDLCFQAREHGLRVLYEPGAVVAHVEGATSGTDPGSGAKRYQEQNRRKFVRKWKERLEAEHMYPAPANVRTAANRQRGKHVLVIDHRVPMPDRDSGSLRMVRMIEALIGLGAHVTFVPDNLAPTQPYTRRLQRMGVEVMYELDHNDVKSEMSMIGPGLTTAILCRPHTTSRWLDMVREFAPAATIAYDTVDLHWLREARRGANAALADIFNGSRGSPDPALMSPKARALRELELAMIRASDVSLVLSEDERVQVARDVPGARVVVVPNVHEIESYVPPPENRCGILFVGSFEHLPNVDAAVDLVNEVMPTVWRELGDVRVTIVGANPPPEVAALASLRVDVAGWVEDLQPLLQQSRLMLAPLRYGAGLKGKVTQCLAVGLPVVTTSTGAEGLVTEHVGADGPDRDVRGLLIADSAREMAVEAIRLYTDDRLWQRVSRCGQELVAERCSTELVRSRLNELLDEIAPAVDGGATPRVPERVARPSVREGADTEPLPHPG